MTSEVDIVNRAIYLIKGNPITSIGQDGIEGESAEVLYPQVRDEVLRAHPWNFAIGRATLVADASSPGFEFDNQYVLPTDFLRALYLYDSREPFKIEGDRLLTDSGTAKLVYIKKITDTGKFDPLFVSALSYKLAAEMAEPVSGSTSRVESLEGRYDRQIAKAKKVDGQEGTPGQLVSDHFINARTNWNPRGGWDV